MARKVILDCDPGIDDAVALCIALFDPRLEVLAVTATAGTVTASQAMTNVQALVERLDPPRYPRFGQGGEPDDPPVVDDAALHGPDGLAGTNFAVSDLQHRRPADKVIIDLLRQFPDEITIVCMGPLTNLARVLQREPGLATAIDRVVISGGAVACMGNVTPAAEFNMYFDPAAAREVFRSATTKSLVPLDVTERVTFGVDLLEDLPGRHTRAGDVLHRLLPYAFRCRHQVLGSEVIPLYDPLALLAVTDPDLFTWHEMAGDVETRGEITRGATIFDQRSRRSWQCNLEAALDVDRETAKTAIRRALQYAGQNT